MLSDSLREKALELPMLPGVYIMKDKHSKVIYVGKAKQLKNRVSSYFHGAHDVKTAVMVSKISDFDVIVSNSEHEALVLENSLIKHHMPKYNIKLRDDKGYPYIRVDTREEYPVFTIVGKPADDGAKYLGPYGGRAITREAIGAVSKALRIPTCGKNLSKLIGKQRPCLNYHMGACDAYCQDAALAERYRESVATAIDAMQGKTAGVSAKLTEEMNEAAAGLLYELAAEKRDRLRAIAQLEQKQLVIAGSLADTDVAGYFRGSARSCFTVLHYVSGRLISKDAELFDTPIEEDRDAMSSIVMQYYDKRGVLPGTIYLPVSTPDVELLKAFFTEKAGRTVDIMQPKRGDKAKLVETANMNAREEVERASTYEEKTLKTLEWLRVALKLEAPPERVEAYDVSNTGSSDIVASLTVFIRWKPAKKEYRRFKIKAGQGQDDYASMAEAVSRRVERYLAGDEKFATLPDLMLIDGGEAHAAAAKSVLEAAGVDLPVLGMVKDDKHRTRDLVTPEGEKVGLSANPAVFAHIGSIQEETHRFAIEYHRSLRSKNSIKSKLDEIEGIGEKRRNELLKRFGSIRAIARAEKDELAAVVPDKVAEKVHAYFHGQDKQESMPEGGGKH
ncbi:MAG: excinuclease ABC subunit UvrC [Oscillospiraceae bacterium]|nr:excinuclease ABC subunit UvrC [Oscillospiraceae bacterium]